MRGSTVRGRWITLTERSRVKKSATLLAGGQEAGVLLAPPHHSVKGVFRNKPPRINKNIIAPLSWMVLHD